MKLFRHIAPPRNDYGLKENTFQTAVSLQESKSEDNGLNKVFQSHLDFGIIPHLWVCRGDLPYLRVELYYIKPTIVYMIIR